jgi:hypothetical protein
VLFFPAESVFLYGFRRSNLFLNAPVLFSIRKSPVCSKYMPQPGL